MTLLRSAALLGVLAGTLPAGASGARVRIEYVAHSCFVVESPDGTRLMIDPYNSGVWLGYRFLDEPPVADAVLVTHPHYDHDASYYWPEDVPVLRRPGRYSVGDVAVEGFAGRHADPWGEEFGQSNTIWVVETGGLRIVHLGDNGPMSSALAEALGRVDVLMIPVDSTFHILKKEEVGTIRDQLKPRYLVPMHYLIPELAAEVDGLGPIDPWLEGREHVVRLERHFTRLTAGDGLPENETVLVFRPHPGVEPWEESYRRGQAIRDELRAKFNDRETRPEPAELIEPLGKVLELQPDSVRAADALASWLARAERPDEAIRILERALAGAGRDDWREVASARLTLARLYQQNGENRLAARQCRLILTRTRNIRLRVQAEGILRTLDEEAAGDD